MSGTKYARIIGPPLLLVYRAVVDKQNAAPRATSGFVRCAPFLGPLSQIMWAHLFRSVVLTKYVAIQPGCLGDTKPRYEPGFSCKTTKWNHLQPCHSAERHPLSHPIRPDLLRRCCRNIENVILLFKAGKTWREHNIYCDFSNQNVTSLPCVRIQIYFHNRRATYLLCGQNNIFLLTGGECSCHVVQIAFPL